MRTLIRTQNDLNTFVESLKTLTLGQLAVTFNKTLKHPEAKAAVDRAIGQKTNKTISDRQARDLAADLLGFENAHVMAAHFKALVNEVLYQPWNIVLEYKGDVTSFMVGIPEGIHPDELSKLELSAAVSGDYNPFSGVERLDVFDAFGEPVKLDKAMDICNGVVKEKGICLTRLYGITGVGFNDAPDVLLADLHDGAYRGTEVDLNWGCIEECSSEFDKALLSGPLEELARVLIREMEVSEALEVMLETEGMSQQGRFDHAVGEHRAIVDTQKGYAGYFVSGELEAAFLFDPIKTKTVN